ncbi:ATP-binding cassette domain-containing protein [Streptomyces cyanogenus]|uniref:Daunorubicin/doxorubicin resistance ATP-binding protein DrrA n=1 Tax=Streptomyces cyanogenus TaxID=80860 RepID=A0ABX7U1W6_STRCY|nr:ATP-binding cassette domain-containing protein [Streptomyces cyanogenus]QTE03030.1 Daunorubicin/doxorubicin resistance ATP-binding protein DrrA [Streptomyces cyanogenus]
MPPPAEAAAIEVRGLRKRFGTTPALDGVDLTVGPGTVCGLLAPNGAGKTTMVRILATLSLPDGGTARVAGHDVVRHPARVRGSIALTGQYAAVDEVISGRDNLEMFARLYRMRGPAVRRRAEELLERFGLTDAGDRPVRTWSGGMRRRLDLAVSLVVPPAVIFLDEPTTGLDPHSRGGLWESVRELVRAGTTVLLTTQYLDEADHLADRIAVLADVNGTGSRVIAEGTPFALKSALGGERVDVTVRDPGHRARVAEILARAGGREPDIGDDPHRVCLAVGAGPVPGTAVLAAALGELDAEGIAVVHLVLRRPTLDEVFLSLTSRPSPDREAV